MISKPLVSILMTAYNREKYISEAIQSVLASSYSHFELIIVDDASTDTTVEMAHAFQKQDCRIKLYKNIHNLGDYPNRNLAASYARGKYLKYVDSDDRIEAGGLETLVQGMEQYPEAGFGICSLKTDAEKPFPCLLHPTEAYQYHFFGQPIFHLGPLNVIFVKRAFDEIGGFKTHRMISDTDMWFRMALKYQVVLMGSGIVWQRRHPKQELSTQHQYIFGAEKIKWNYLKDPACGLTPAQLEKIKGNRLKRYTGFILSGIKTGNLHQVISYLKCFRFVSKINVKRLGE